MRVFKAFDSFNKIFKDCIVVGRSNEHSREIEAKREVLDEGYFLFVMFNIATIVDDFSDQHHDRNRAVNLPSHIIIPI